MTLIYMHWVQQAGSADAQTTLIILISVCCNSELHSAINKDIIEHN